MKPDHREIQLADAVSLIKAFVDIPKCEGAFSEMSWDDFVNKHGFAPEATVLKAEWWLKHENL